VKNKILILGIIVSLIVVLFTLTGCGNNKENSNSADTTNEINEAKKVDGEVENLIKNYYKYFGEKNADEIAKLFDLAKMKENGFFDSEKDYGVTTSVKVDKIQDVYNYAFETSEAEALKIELKEILKLENSDDIDTIVNKMLELNSENENNSEDAEKNQNELESYKKTLEGMLSNELKLYYAIVEQSNKKGMFYFFISEDNKIVNEQLFQSLLSYYTTRTYRQGNTGTTTNSQSSATNAIKAGPYSLKYGKYTDKYGTTYTLNSDGTYTCKSTESGERYSSSGTYIIYKLEDYEEEINKLNEPLGISDGWFIALNYNNADTSKPYLMDSYNIKANNEFYFGQTDEVWTYQGN